jgi:recombination protein RecR
MPFEENNLPNSLEELANTFKTFPGVGYRSGLKLALDILDLSPQNQDQLLDKIRLLKQKVGFCTECGFFCEKKISNQQDLASIDLASKDLVTEEPKNLCKICTNKNRNYQQICLLEKPTDVLTIEKSRVFSGRYHVLNKLISPLDNIFAPDTTISSLLEVKIPKYLAKIPENLELILFFKNGFAAEATTAYIKDFLANKGLAKRVRLTRLAQGLPLYFNPDTLDQATMVKALEDRRDI